MNIYRRLPDVPRKTSHFPVSQTVPGARRIACAIPAICLVVFFTTFTPTRAAKPSSPRNRKPDLSLPHHPEQLLVRFKRDVKLGDRASVHAKMGATQLKQYHIVDGLTLVRVPPNQLEKALEKYQSDPSVLYAEPDYEYFLDATPDDTYFCALWGLDNTGDNLDGCQNCVTVGGCRTDPGTPGSDINATRAWDLFTGDPAFRVAVIDTGVDYNHPDLAANMWTNPGEIPGNGIDDDGNGYVDDVHGYDFENDDGDPLDDNSHGTHVAGTIAGVGNNAVGVTGVSWRCSIVALKVFPASGSQPNSSVFISAMQYVIDNQIRLSNNSWGGGGFSQGLYDAILASQEFGHIFVAAAGNNGNLDNDQFPHYPSSYDLPNIVVVAATDNDDNLATFSHFGATTVDLGAPGVNTYSTEPDSSYGFKSGTSMATPHVVGAVALMMGRRPDWTWQEVRDRLLGNVRLVPSLAGFTVTGGVLDAFRSLGDCNDNGIDDDIDLANGTSEDCNQNAYPDECEPGGTDDCNNNGEIDLCDIYFGISGDCNGNGVPDECDPGGTDDCNDNGTIDLCDIHTGTSTDCNDNTVPDECDIAVGTSNDCNGNSVPDECDLETGTSSDCNVNGIPDECDPGGGEDCNGNGQVDFCDIIVGASPDCNDNLVPDECDLSSGASPDCNSNNVPDECDLLAGTSEDCNANDVPDECEPGGTEDCNANNQTDLCDIYLGMSGDCNVNAVPDECEPGGTEDCNGNGAIDLCDIHFGISSDCNGNAVPDECEPGGTDDCNDNGTIDLCDIFLQFSPDCNFNGVPDECDLTAGTSPDCNEDNIPDECQTGGTLDCNNNGEIDLCDIHIGTSPDCNNNAVPDECDITDESSPDCNANTVPDECDIATGTSPDCNADDVPDECTGQPHPFPMSISANGSRYISVTPPFGTGAQLSIRVRGAVSDPSVGCLTRYVQADGTLGASAFSQTADEWCRVNIHGLQIIPEASYEVDVYDGSVWTVPVAVTTSPWGDVTGDGFVNVNDIVAVLAAANGSAPLSALFRADQIASFPDPVGCVPDGIVDQSDIDSVIWAFQHQASELNGYPCPAAGDCNLNGTVDLCEAAGVTDCNLNASLDLCDVYAGASFDCNADDVPDECAGQPHPFSLSIEAAGSRYILVTPDFTASAPVAIRVRGADSDPIVRCMSLFVQADGMLGEDVIYQWPQDWCRVHIQDPDIIPDATYLVDLFDGVEWTVPVSVSTGLWGDVNGDLIVNVTDIQNVLAASNGSKPASELPTYDMIGGYPDPLVCAPDGVVDQNDADACVSAFQGIPFPCPEAGPFVCEICEVDGDCNDLVACTLDSCNTGTGECENVPSDAECDDGMFCNGQETCDALNDCQPGTDPCAGLFCFEGSDTCEECSVDADCDDGLFCNGAETCDPVSGCVAGSPPCSPFQFCDELGNRCRRLPVPVEEVE